ncbi:transport and Golgi organization protein 6 homolog [Dendroctonus ponderosae]|uniref:transport and Golgi organization protein 6 homolog n=1 Tax=Dendroctonus ponderosae TaxID=77166 RepID=UPI0020363220|nr:transport and Golgi organization protein 6 homolog [Dendroctonus ponderosae]KAH1010003.1 hypothetical protein HUJ05_004366 [Dendroctonus ponderosae]
MEGTDFGKASWFVDQLRCLRIENLKEKYVSQFSDKCVEANKMLGSFEKIERYCENITKHYFSDPKLIEWQYLAYNLYLLKRLGEVLEANDDIRNTLSVKETQDARRSIEEVVTLGIQTKLVPKLPYRINQVFTCADDKFYEYNLLKCTVFALCDFLHNASLRPIILPDSLKIILTGLYQIGHCVLKSQSDLEVNDQLYEQLLSERRTALALLEELEKTIHPSIYVKAIMMMPDRGCPVWFNKAVYQVLSRIMNSPKGIEKIAVAVLDGVANDQTKSWYALDVLFRLIERGKKQSNFLDMCKQVVRLAHKYYDEPDCFIYERLFVLCTKNFFKSDENGLCTDLFVQSVLEVLLRFTLNNYRHTNRVITQLVKKNIRLIHQLFVQPSECPSLPVIMLQFPLQVIFKIFLATMENNLFKTTHYECKAILRKFIADQRNDDAIFDAFMFEIYPDHIMPFTNKATLNIDGQDIVVNPTEHSSISPTAVNSEGICQLLGTNPDWLSRFFNYLLRCLVHREKYFPKCNEELLTLEEELANPSIERQLAVFRCLATLAADQTLQSRIVESPQEIIKFIKKVLEDGIAANAHTTTNYESHEFQSIFTVVMILQSLMSNCTRKEVEAYQVLNDPLWMIRADGHHEELLEMIYKVLEYLDLGGTTRKNTENLTDDRLKFDTILKQIYDPLLPVRGHALLTLRKLVENRETLVKDRKQAILTIFRENLNNQDSFIYLNAIEGVAALCNSFTDTVINTLCEEFSESARTGDDRHEVRLKLGEVLVRVSKNLGEMAPRYKAVLLNAFLVGTKDDDPLVRASSLSNLGEICRVLGFKLGSIISEILVCVNSIIATDKSAEPRRAAVAVLRQLFQGLATEILVELKESLLPIYKMLKNIYYNDKDDTMRLHAQLALEELNDCIVGLTFATPVLSTEKKIVLMK